MNNYLKQIYNHKKANKQLLIFLVLMPLLMTSNTSLAQAPDSLKPATSWYVVPRVGAEVYSYFEDLKDPYNSILRTDFIPKFGIEAGIRRDKIWQGIILLYGRGIDYDPQASVLFGTEIKNHWSASYAFRQDWIDWAIFGSPVVFNLNGGFSAGFYYFNGLRPHPDHTWENPQPPEKFKWFTGGVTAEITPGIGFQIQNTRVMLHAKPRFILMGKGIGIGGYYALQIRFPKK